MAQDNTEFKIIQDDTPIWGASASRARSGSTAPPRITCCRATCCPRGASVGGGSQAALGSGRR
jgi:hypothetical protein